MKCENAVTSKFKEVLQVTTRAETILNVITEDIGEIAATSSPIKRSYVTTIQTKINALKEFKPTTRCINCKKNITVTSDMIDTLVMCDCSAQFVPQPSKISNECQLLLSDTNQWFTASKGVSLSY